MRTCRLCLERGHLVPVMDLGHHPLADRFLTADQIREPEVTYPLSLRLCTACGYVGTDYLVPAPTRYADPAVSYSYTAGNSAMSHAHFGELAEAIAQRVPASAMARAGQLAGTRLVVDVGGNDGTLLRAIKRSVARGRGTQRRAVAGDGRARRTGGHPDPRGATGWRPVRGCLAGRHDQPA